MVWRAALKAAWRRAPRERHVLLLGLFCWTVTAFLPSLHRRDMLSASAWPLLCLGPGVLVLGIRSVRSRPRIAPFLLLTAFPLTLGASVAQLAFDVSLATYPPSVAAFLLASLFAYGAGALTLCDEREERIAVEVKPFDEPRGKAGHPRRRQLGRLVLAAVTLGGLAITLWGSWATGASYRSHWREAGAHGATLTALLAGLSAAVVVAMVGPALRADRAPPSPTQSLRRALWLLLVAVSGALVYAAARGSLA